MAPHFRFSDRILVCITSFMHATYPTHLILLDVITFRKKNEKLLVENFLQPPVTFTLLDPSIIRNTMSLILHDSNKLITRLPKVNVHEIQDMKQTIRAIKTKG